ncbi:MAG: hypothetical protein J6112_05340 [Clostridia bacterium]|nr:hypothetical protein [Clostridia bacterium]
MNTTEIIILIIGAVLFSGLVFSVFFTFYIAKRVYDKTLIRPENEPRERKCSAPDNEEQALMFRKGLEWAKAYADRMTSCEIENDGLKLFGEYYGFGGSKAVIIIPGRTESLAYSYYYAEPYRKAGFNVLVIDSRATGLSDGKYFSMGTQEHRDIIEWSRLLHDGFANKTVFLHGICIGSSTALYTLVSENCPGYVTGMCADGMYKNFFETYRLHMKEWNKPAFPVAYEVMLILWKNTGANCLTYGPYKALKKLDKPIFFIYTDKDQYSLPCESKKLFENCAATVKEIHWFHEGTHSHVRINNEEEYDAAIADFTERHADIL